MKKHEEAAEIFNKGFNCSQSVFSVFSDDFGIARNDAAKIARGFGGGIARLGEVCGAVSGAVMVLGLKQESGNLKEEEKKEDVYDKVNEFVKKFKEKNSSILCKDLLGEDLLTENGRHNAKEKNLHETVCTKLVKDAVEILEEILKNK